MDTMIFDQGHSLYLVNSARLVKPAQAADVARDLAGAGIDWALEESNPFIQWISGDFVESDNPNQNTQFWTAGDLELAEYTIRFAPLNMVHKFRTPIGFFANTKTVTLEREAEAELTADAAGQPDPLKIQALSGLWTHIFPFEAAQVEAADDMGLLFYSMECRGTHLTCGTDEAKGLTGCGETFEYMDLDSHCQHLQERSSVRHIVSPTFRGGAVIVPPVKPGWQNASASIVGEAVMQEAAAFAAQTEAQYKVLNESGHDLSTSAWETLMAQVVASTAR